MGDDDTENKSDMRGESPNIAVVILDTLRYDAFERHFGWLPGKRFSHAFSTSHHSVPSHASLFTGRYPSEIGVHVKSPALDYSRPTLAEQLQMTGYTTYGFHENWHLANWEGWGRGFDKFTMELKTPSSDIFDWEEFECEFSGPLEYLFGIYCCVRSDAKTYDSLLNGLRRYRGTDFLKMRIKSMSSDSPMFLFTNLIDAHQPYSAPDKYFSFDEPIRVHNIDSYRDPGYDRSKIRQAYDEGVMYLSDRYKRIFKILENKFDYIITTADHGELLGEHGRWTHGPGIHPEITHIPLVISGPEISEETCDAPVSLLDVHGTVCEIARISHDSRGQDLRYSIDPIPRLTEYHGTQPWQYPTFMDHGIPETFEKYDVQLDGIVGDGFYGYETVDGFRTIGESPWADPQKKLAELRATIPRKEPDDSWLSVEEATNEALSDEAKNRLKDLGYI